MTESGQVDGLRTAYATGRTRSPAWRIEQLRCVERMLLEHEAQWTAALHADLGRCETEAAVEIGLVANEVRYALKHLRRWVKPQRTATPLINQPGRSTILREPYGVVLILGPWNYPVNLILTPLIGAIAAGNCVLIKPSEIAAHTSAAMAELLPRYLDPQCISVVEGGIADTQTLLSHRFDYLFFTGSTHVGRIIAAAAARHLTPVTLELGGKCPCLVDIDVDLPVAARRIVWAKFMNAGQTCVAPDYVLVHRSRQRELLDAMVETLRQFYGPDPRQSRDYGRIINERHYGRLCRLLDQGDVVVGGDHDPGMPYMAPTILTNVPADAPVMTEEIFGPILPVMAVDDFDEALTFVRARPKPLAVYLFSRDKDTHRRVLDGTSSGSVCINDLIGQLAVPGLPFGGVGLSGIGAYHGRHSFETFSHAKAVLTRSTRLDLSVRYPPYNRKKLAWLKRLLSGRFVRHKKAAATSPPADQAHE